MRGVGDGDTGGRPCFLLPPLTVQAALPLLLLVGMGSRGGATGAGGVETAGAVADVVAAVGCNKTTAGFDLGLGGESRSRRSTAAATTSLWLGRPGVSNLLAATAIKKEFRGGRSITGCHRCWIPIAASCRRRSYLSLDVQARGRPRGGIDGEVAPGELGDGAMGMGGWRGATRSRGDVHAWARRRLSCRRRTWHGPELPEQAARAALARAAGAGGARRGVELQEQAARAVRGGPAGA